MLQYSLVVLVGLACLFVIGKSLYRLLYPSKDADAGCSGCKACKGKP